MLTVRFFTFIVMSISSHRDHPDRVLVGVMRGVVHLVSLQVRRSLKSFPTDSSPLQMADWAPCNSKSVAALSNGELIHWDIAKTRLVSWRYCIIYGYSTGSLQLVLLVFPNVQVYGVANVFFFVTASFNNFLYIGFYFTLLHIFCINFHYFICHITIILITHLLCILNYCTLQV